MASPVVERTSRPPFASRVNLALRILGAAALSLPALAACGSSATPSASHSNIPSVSSLTASPPPPTTGSPTPSTASTSAAPVPAPPVVPAAPPAFTASVTAVSAADLGASYRGGCPVGPESLRALTMSYWGFDNAPHTGILVVHVDVVSAVQTIFQKLYDARFPIRSMRPTSEFGGSDPASMDADNTSGFNCRNAVTSGPPQWSVHAYGKAIDVNTIENPYIEGGTVMPAAGASYTNRGVVRPGMAVPGSVVNTAFAAAGWQWGGRWSDPDYQHFSATGG